MLFRIYGPPALTRQFIERAETTERAQRLHTRAKVNVELINRALERQTSPLVEQLDGGPTRISGRSSGKSVSLPDCSGRAELEYIDSGRIVSVRR